MINKHKPSHLAEERGQLIKINVKPKQKGLLMDKVPEHLIVNKVPNPKSGERGSDHQPHKGVHARILCKKRKKIF